MWFPFRRAVQCRPRVDPGTATERLRAKYECFRELLGLNTECLEIMAELQQDLRYVLPRRDVVGGRVGQLFDKARQVVDALERLMGMDQSQLRAILDHQHDVVARFLAAEQEVVKRRLSAWLFELSMANVAEVGGKAAALGEVKNRLRLPVPDGYVITTEAYWQAFGLPLWQEIRDAIERVSPDEPDQLYECARKLQEMILQAPLPRAVEVAIVDRAKRLVGSEGLLAVRSSAVGEGPEGGPRSYAGQFLSLLNVPVGEATSAYRRVIASRFSERALAYRLFTGIAEVESPMAVLFLPVIRPRASGIMYTRDPSAPRSQHLWITSTWGLGLEIASGRMPADLFIVSRGRRVKVEECQLAEKTHRLLPADGPGLQRLPVAPDEARAASLSPEQLAELARCGALIEEHFGAPQDIEWAIDESGQLWILQTRPLAMGKGKRTLFGPRAKAVLLASGGRTVFPGQASGPACLIEHAAELRRVPAGSILIMRRASPEISQVVTRIRGLVAEVGNIAGHAAALLREFRVPSVFQMAGVIDKVKEGQWVSLDASGARIYEGQLWEREAEIAEVPERKAPQDPIHQQVLTLYLTDPAGHGFRPAGCRSLHDVLRYAHEKAVEAMFTVSDWMLEAAGQGAKELQTEAPLNLVVLDLGGGLQLADPSARKVTPEQIVSRPFRALWRGASRPDVSWKREMPASLGDLASVVASSLRPQEYAGRPLGGKSYLLVARDYMNLNARLAYHFSLVDACLTDEASLNYIAFRFVGGGSTAYRRSLRAQFVERVLIHYGFLCDRRGDLVNAWLRKAPPEQTEYCLDILGRLLACSSQLDMYMASPEVMRWYVEQFLRGNYRFDPNFTGSPDVRPLEGT